MPIHKYNLSIAGQKMLLLFDLDPEAFYSDAALLHYLSNGMMPEPEVVNAMAHILKPGDCCVDAGANIGFFTVIMSKLIGDDGIAYAIEPDPRNVKKLRKNLDINDCRNVQVISKPLGRLKNQLVFFQLRKENGTSSLYGDDGETQIPMTVVRITDLLEGRRPKFMKMDIEGAELEALRGCDARIPFIISEMNQEALQLAGASIDELRNHMATWGHDLHILSETGSMPAMMSATQKLVPTKKNANVLFARHTDVVRAWPEVVL